MMHTDFFSKNRGEAILLGKIQQGKTMNKETKFIDSLTCITICRTNGFIDMLKLHSWWKASTTYVFPSFHMHYCKNACYTLDNKLIVYIWIPLFFLPMTNARTMFVQNSLTSSLIWDNTKWSCNLWTYTLERKIHAHMTMYILISLQI
jgi:hypothetical protein